MVVYVTYRVPVEVELETDIGEIIDVHIVDEKLEGPLGVYNYELLPIEGPVDGGTSMAHASTGHQGGFSRQRRLR